MLNELYTLSGALSKLNIELKKWHREYKALPKVTNKAPCLRLWLSDAGKIDSITEVSADLAAKLRKFGDNMSTFPAFNIVPLYRITEKEQIDALERIIADNALFDPDTVKSWCTSDNWRVPDINKKTSACVVKRSKKLLELINKQSLPAPGSVLRLISIAGAYAKDDASFREALETCVFQKLQQRDNIALYLKALFQTGSDRSNLSIILDVSDWEQYGYPVAHERTTEQINEILLNTDSETVESSEKHDAFGAPYSDVGEPMPGIKLEGLSNVILRAMFHEQRCQYRYGKINDESYPIAKENRATAQSSFEWLAKAENQGSTWEKVDQNEIIFVYPSVFPEIPQKFVGIFAPQQIVSQQNDKDDEKPEKRFKNIAEKIAKSLKGLSPEKKPKNIQVFAIRKMDKARSKVVFNRNCSPEWLFHAAEEWERGCSNLPDLDIRAFPAKKPGEISSDKQIPERISQVTPFPLQIPPVVNSVWKQNGEPAQGKSGVKRMQYYQGMELLLDPVEKSAAQYYLQVLLTHSSGLIQYTGNQQHRGLAASSRQAHDIGFLMSALGLLLYKCAYVKGGYMENTAYLVGQILKISDELHALYCKVVRKGEVPAQLAGNSIFVTATETPTQALAQLCLRVNPYIAWAKQYRVKNILTPGQESWKAGWYLNLYETTASKLTPLLADASRFNDFDKAQLFIGYLAAFPKREKADPVDPADANGDTSTTQGDNGNE